MKKTAGNQCEGGQATNSKETHYGRRDKEQQEAKK